MRKLWWEQVYWESSGSAIRNSILDSCDRGRIKESCLNTIYKGTADPVLENEAMMKNGSRAPRPLNLST
jgi:hypothetical protein